jgi:hypothetical protein
MSKNSKQRTFLFANHLQYDEENVKHKIYFRKMY